jgi:translation initiation factor 1
MSNKNKNKEGVVYSTNPNFEYTDHKNEEQETPSSSSQNLRVWLERGKGGKVATIIRGFIGTETDFQELGKQLKQLCGAGGSAKNGEIIVQGDARDKILNHLIKNGFNAKKAGG